MKKRLVLFLFTLVSLADTPAQSRTFNPETIVSAALDADQFFGVASRHDREDKWDQCDCKKCQKKNKYRGCSQRGHHYGKQKNKHGKHKCSCDHNTSHDRGSRDRDTDDRYYGRNGNDRDDEYRNHDRPQQRKPVARVKNRTTPVGKPAPKRSGAKRKESPRPVPRNK